VTGAMSQRKGKRWELAVVHRIQRATGLPGIKRGFQCRDGAEAPDVDGVPGFWIEVKAHRRVNLRAALAQAIAAAPADRTPVAICKDDRQEPVAVMLFDDFTSRSGSDAPDVDVAGWWFETKIGKKPNLRAALAQAIAAAPADRTPVAICKDDRKDPLVVLRLDDFMTLLSPSKEVPDHA